MKGEKRHSNNFGEHCYYTDSVKNKLHIFRNHISSEANCLRER